MRPYIIKHDIEIPEGVVAMFDEKNRKIIVKGPKGELERTLDYPNIKVFVDEKNRKISILSYFPTRRDKSILNSWRKHIYNMIVGVTKGFKYKLRAVYVHFPFKVEIRGSELVVDNFLGEKKPRVLRIPDGVSVKVNGNEITVESIDIEKAGNVAGMIEQLTKVRRKDIRKFQDGIYIVEKPYYKYI